VNAAEPITVHCRPDGLGWSCTVRVGSRAGVTQHEVSVSAAELDRFGHGATDPTSLVDRSFRFLLEHEPKESILRRFAISDIDRYFPEYPGAITRGAE